MASGGWSYRSVHRLAMIRAARPEETIGTSFVRSPPGRYWGRSKGSPAPEKMMSISLGDRRLDELPEVREGHHDIDPQDALRAQGLRPPDLLAERPEVGGLKMLEQVRLDHPDPGRGDDPDPARVGHRRGQPGQGHADPHAALDDGQRRGQVPDAQRLRATLGHDCTHPGGRHRERRDRYPTTRRINRPSIPRRRARPRP